MQFTVRVKGQGKPIPQLEVTKDLVGGRFAAPARGTSVSFRGVSVRDVDFGRATFSNLRSGGTLFERCDFSQVRFAADYASYLCVGPVSTFRDCSFERADLRHTDPGLSRFERCVFDGAKMHDWVSEAAEFVDCRFATKLTQSFFFGRPHGVWGDKLDPPRAINEFRGNDFSGATLIGVSFKFGIDIAAQRWPDDPAYIRLDRLPERIRLAREIVARWPDDAGREDALLVLRIYSTHGYEEQEELFARRDNLADNPKGLDRLWNLLRTVL